MIQKPKRLLAMAAICAGVWFLSGAPEITESTGLLPQIIVWVGFGFALASLAFLALGLRGLFVGRSPEN